MTILLASLGPQAAAATMDLGTVSISDQAASQVQPSAAPEPGSIALIASGLLLFLFLLRRKLVRSGGGVLLMSLLFAPAIPAQGIANWVQQNPQTSPPARTQFALDYDSARGQIVLFGGENMVTTSSCSCPPPLNETWVWNGANWAQKSPQSNPPGRAVPAMVYDPLHSQLVLFGGFGGSGLVTALSDTWVWDGSIWTQKFPQNSPPARGRHAMAYDSAHGQVVLFGGSTSYPPGGDLNDTWIWDGSNWTQKSPQISPSPRIQPGMVYDSAHSQMVLFGGFGTTSSTATNDTWIWDGSNWTQRLPQNRPPARWAFGMAYDSAHRQVVLFGGAANFFMYLNDTWTWDGATWTQQMPPSSPAARRTLIAYDSMLAQIVLFGGHQPPSGNFVFGDTWVWSGGPLPPSPPTITGVNLPTGGAPHLSPGAPMNIAGSNLGTSSSDAAAIKIGGKAAPVLTFSSPARLLAQVPVDMPLGSTTVTATSQNQSSAPFNLTVDAFSPGIYSGVSAFSDSSGTPISAVHPATPGTVVSCSAIGLGPTNPPMVTGVKATAAAPTTMPVQVMVGNKMVLPDYAGLLVGSITDYKVTFKVPQDVPAGDQPVTLSVGAVTSNSVTLQVAPPMPTIGAVVSAGAFGGFSSVAPGSWVEIYGSNLADHTRQWAGSDFNGLNAPTMLDGVQVVIGGQKAYVDYISSGQVNAQLPSNIGTGQTQIILTSAGVNSAPFNITVNTTQPGLLAPPSFKIGGNQYVVAQFSDLTYVLPAGAIAGVTSRPAKPGETIVIYGIGFGSVTPNIPAGQIVTQANQLSMPLQIFFGQTLAQTPYFGLAPNFVGLYQFNVVVPAVSDNDLVPLTFTLGGVAGTQTLYIAVRQ